ncbi:hypothetical protein [Roseobacter litoralis]|uniref:hypothetical protein n=1 Tax=Roseobacter litoralis TaxID=42443 RepID=UPI00248FF0E7|nr:hypothetical protein [Roseobacter litoralis]
MKKIFAALFVLSVAGHSAVAQEGDGSSLMERGAQQFLEGLLQEMQPAWEEMRSFMEEMGPAMMGMMEEVKDWSAYEPPEMLENGDIIIRRKPEGSPIPEQTEPVPQIEL